MSLRAMRNAAVFRSAQSTWDAMSPPDDDGSVECPVCDGVGHRMVLDEDFKPWRDVCEVCKGMKFLDEYGLPYDPEARPEYEGD